MSAAAERRDTHQPKRGGVRVLSVPDKNRAQGRGSRTMVKPQWTIAEIGQAAHSLPETEFRAALFAFAGLQDHRWFLHEELMGQARMFMRIYHWPDRCKDFHGLNREYVDLLCMLVLDEDAHPAYFKAVPGLFAFYLSVSERVWENQLEGRYLEMRHTWLDWTGHAARVIQAQLSEEE